MMTEFDFENMTEEELTRLTMIQNSYQQCRPMVLILVIRLYEKN